MKQLSTKAIILKRISFGEADRILTVITPDYGKVSILAKGVRKSKSKLAGGLELFSVSSITYIDGRSELKTVVSTRLLTHYGDIVKDITATMLAYEFLKLIDAMTRETCDEKFFELLVEGLTAINEGSNQLDIVAVWFMVQVLQLTGFGINIQNQVNESNFKEESQYSFSFDDMGFYVDNAGQFTSKHIKFLRLLHKVSNPKNLIKVDGAEQLSASLKSLLTQCTQLAI